MKKKSSIWWYLFLGIGICVIDRLTKQFALANFVVPQQVSSWFTFELILNRGVSWGMLHSQNSLVFVLLSAVIVTMIALLAVYTLLRWRQHFFIVGEILALSGALSNVVDRVVYGGVIDFIVLTVNGCAPFGVFNIADVSIVAGILVVFVTAYTNDEKKI
jgi:signal peptidase II